MIRLALLPLLLLAACRGETEADLVAKAKAELAKPDVAAATIHVKNALEKNPNASEARLLLGRVLLAGGDAVNAQIEFRRALGDKALENQVVPDLVRAMLMRGESAKVIGEFGDRVLSTPEATADLKALLAGALAGQGDAAGAREALSQALQALPGHAQAIVLSARLDAGAGKLDAAVAQLDEVLAKNPGHEGAGLLKGEILRQARQDTDGAMALFRQVRTANPRSVPGHVAVVGLLLQQGKAAEARADFAALQKLNPKHPDTLFLQAQLALAEKDYKGAREVVERLLASAPNNVRLLMLAGAAEIGLQQYTQASALLEKAQKAAPGLPAVRQMLAQSLMKGGEADKALEVLRPLVDSPAADSKTLGLAGEAWLMVGDSTKAEAAFQRALKAAPGDTRLRTAMAVAQLSRGDNAPALAQLESIAQGDAGSQADLAVISARLRQKDLPGALKAIDALQRKQPTQALPLVLRSRVQASQGDKAAARASLEAALKLQPNHLPAVVSLAALDVDAGQAPAARKRFEDVIKAEPQNVKARMALTELDRRLGAPDAALVTQLREAVRANPGEPAAHLALVERLLASGDGPAAQAAAQDASAALPNDLAVMDALGLAQLAAGDSQRAISTYKRLAALQPRNPMHLARLADAHLAGKDNAAANAALKQALEIQPDHLMSQRGLALLAMMDKRPQDALAIARSIQKRLPKDPVGHVLEGELESRNGNWPAAATAFAAALQRSPGAETAIRLHAALQSAGKAAEAGRMAADWQKAHPKDIVFRYHLGDVAASNKDWAGAEAHYRAVLALQPRHAAAMNNIAYILATEKKPGAVAMAEQALAILPDRAPILDTLSVAQEAENQLGKAIDTQKRAAELDPRNPMLRLRLAQLHVKKGNKSDARDLLEPLARLGPSFGSQDEVARLLKQL
jgi:cellulose synthase operon protein C